MATSETDIAIRVPEKQHISEVPPPPYESTSLPYSNEQGETSRSTPQLVPRDPTELPPSYESLFGRVRAAKRESSGFPDFMKKFVILLLSTLGCTICVGIVMAIPVSMVVIGSLKLNMCPIERYIPIYLIVGGSFGILKNSSSLIKRLCCKKEESEEDTKDKTSVVDSLVSCFLLAWFIAGNVWIYRISNSWSSDPKDVLLYCDPTLYYFAFWLTTSIYIIALLGCCCICCSGVIASLAGSEK